MATTSDPVVDARCEIQGKAGTIRFVGPTAFATGEWFGVELDEPSGENNGSVNGKYYFNCKPNHGIFVRASQISGSINSPQSQQYNVSSLKEMLHHHHDADGGVDTKKNKQPKLNHPLEFLFGTWYGEGSGEFEGIDDFIYNEEIAIHPDEAGRGWLYYRQKTWNPMKNNSNFHSEMGYIRTPGMSDKVELVLAQPTGIASIEEGRIDGTTIMFRSTDISRSTTAKPPHVSEYTRTWTVDPINETMTYVFNMSTQHKQMAHHLSATLSRIPKKFSSDQ